MTNQVISLSIQWRADLKYESHDLSIVNDHVVRVSTITEPYMWHIHPNSDETFFPLEGGIFVDLMDRTVELRPGSIFTVPKGEPHRPRPIESRAVSVLFEAASICTEPCDAPRDIG